MSRVIETTVYQFEELSEAAKERARDWYRGCIESDELADYDDWETIAEILGVSFRTRAVPLMGGGTRYDPCIYWSGFNSQGDGASFEGSYRYAKQAPKRIREHAPLDKELHRIADELADVQRRHFYQLTADIRQGVGSNYYSHSGTMAVDVSRADGLDISGGWTPGNSLQESEAEATVTQLMRDLADWIYRQLEAQWEYLNSDEAVDESIIANEYEFDESGERV